MWKTARPRPIGAAYRCEAEDGAWNIAFQRVEFGVPNPVPIAACCGGTGLSFSASRAQWGGVASARSLVTCSGMLVWAGCMVMWAKGRVR